MGMMGLSLVRMRMEDLGLAGMEMRGWSLVRMGMTDFELET